MTATKRDRTGHGECDEGRKCPPATVRLEHDGCDTGRCCTDLCAACLRKALDLIDPPASWDDVQRLRERLDKFEAYAITVASALADREGLDAASTRVRVLEGALAGEREEHVAARREVKRLTGLLEECNAVCLCGCPAGEHESYGEDGESCGKDDHECIRVAPAVLAGMEKERAARREAEEKLEKSRKAIVFTRDDFMRVVETLYVPAEVKGNTLAEVLNTLLEERLEMRGARKQRDRLREVLEEEVIFLQASEDFGPLARLSRIRRVCEALGAQGY